MLARYNPQINVSQKSDKYGNVRTIGNFIKELNLPKKLTKKPKKEGELIDNENFERQLSDEFWEKIDKI